MNGKGVEIVGNAALRKTPKGAIFQRMCEQAAHSPDQKQIEGGAMSRIKDSP